MKRSQALLKSPFTMDTPKRPRFGEGDRPLSLRGA